MSADHTHEAKLIRLVDMDTAKRLSRLSRLPNAKLGRLIAEHVYAVYYDTDACDLRRDGLSLCLSHSGLGRVQTVELAEADHSGRVIDAASINGSDPAIARIAADDVRDRVASLTRDQALSPVFETRVLQLRRDIRTDEGDRLSLAIDQGEIHARAKSEPISELTLALESGSPERLQDVARALKLSDIVPVARLERGYALANSGPAQSPTKPSAIALPKNATVGDALRASLLSARDHLIANISAVTNAEDPEGVHQMRVGLRRLRTICAAFAPTPAGQALRILDKKARVLGRTLGRARDLDVFLDETFPAAAQHLAAEGSLLEPLLEAARAARVQAWSDALAAIKSPDFDHLIAEIAASATSTDWPKAARKTFGLQIRVKPFARGRLTVALDRVEALAVKLKRLDETQRHTLRKRLKRLRYTGDLFESVFSKSRSRKTLKRLSRLQDTFGTLNDAAVAADLSESIAAGLEAQGAQAEADAVRRGAALVNAWYQPRAEALFGEARKRWREFSEGELFWE